MKTQQGGPVRSRKSRGRKDKTLHRKRELDQATRIPDEEVINKARTGKERGVHENVCILIGPGRKRQLQVIRTRLYRFFLHSFEQVVGRIIAVKQVTVGYLNIKIIYKSAGTDAALEMFCRLIRLRTTSVPS
ncbi:hypothetical protein TNCV_2920971 [Trichonephila clavipes]|nr:hypothetical protein TNCV_2920971 [Trichonephila clavipes]